MKKAFWKTDWFVGVCLAVTILLISKFSFLQTLEHLVYDASLNINLSAHKENSSVVVIAIDERSTESLGRWPWSRNLLAQLILDINVNQARSITLIDPLTEKENSPVLPYLQKIKKLLESSQNEQSTSDSLQKIRPLLDKSLQEASTDINLAKVIDHAGNVFVRTTIARHDRAMPPAKPQRLPSSSIQLSNINSSFSPLKVDGIVPPIAVIEKRALGSGHLLYTKDKDNKIRRHPLLIGYKGQYYPSLVLQIAANELGYKAIDLKRITGKRIQMGTLSIPMDYQFQNRPFFYAELHASDKSAAFPVYSAVDILSHKVPAEQFREKAVLIGTTGQTARNTYTTPLRPFKESAEVMLLANSVNSLLNGRDIQKPSWALLLQLLAWAGILIYLSKFLRPLVKRNALIFSSVLLLLLIAGECLLLGLFSLWIPLLWPAVFLISGHLLILCRQQPKTIDGSTTVKSFSNIAAQNNYTIGKTFLQQGQLDWAFDKFKQAPYSEALMDELNTLADRYTQSNQHTQAYHVYQHMEKQNQDYPGLQKALDKAHLQAANSTTPTGKQTGRLNLPQNRDDNRNMLGRYQIDKVLGQGAMGKVYLGRDTQINRVVAIKTLPLAEEFDESEFENVKARFFREAETAGKLNHPNIVTIYDVGEEGGLAYIAMEYLTGHDLSRYTKVNNLLPSYTVLGMAYKAAKALAYAHSHKIIHRDIKPANLMLDPGKKKIIITDFGIARIVGISRTRTGIVLGTPSYMSPEQLSGQPIDGRTDLFSLGVMLFQLLTGKLPFNGDSLSTLMYSIANDPHQDILAIRPELGEKHPGISNLIDIALAKEADKRFQTGEQMAKAIRQFAKK